jgi:hypothetical protein
MLHCHLMTADQRRTGANGAGDISLLSCLIT